MPASVERPAPEGAGDLSSRLAELTLQDEDRLSRRLHRLASTRDAEQRGRDLERLVAEVAKAEERVARRRDAVPPVSYPPELPVSARHDELLETIRDHQVVVVAGETGSGKTTQIPKLCLELGRGVRGAIAHTQPRRIAARTVAERIGSELGVGLGDAVGYSVRFDDRSTADTLVRLMTDGLLLAEVGRDRLLRRYDTIIVDEAHERSLNIDFLLGYLRSILPKRPDLKLIITSATIEPGRFAAHFGDAPVVEVTGRTYPVEVRYRPLAVEVAPEGADDEEELDDGPHLEDRDPTEAIGDAVDELLREPGGGDVLVFLSGEREIRDTAEVLEGRLRGRAHVLPLFGRLSAAEQQRIFRPHAERRIVLATNVAETSVTVPGIRFVVDTGLARISRYSARLKVQRLPIEPISQASADQRKGRCGRTSAGVCIRLYGEEDFLTRPRYTDPEVQRTNLASVLLQMASLRLGPIGEFGFLDPPDGRQVRDGVALLDELGALDEEQTGLTKIGRALAGLPVDPRLGRMVLEADRLSCAEEVCVIAAALSLQDVRERPLEHRAHADQLHARFKDEESDFLAQLNLWRYLREIRSELSGNQFRKRCKAEHLNYLRVREWQDLVSQLKQAAKQAGVTFNQQPGESLHVHQALLAGLLSHVGLRDAARREYQGARNARFQIFPGSALARKQPAWVVVAELVETSRLWGRTAAKVQPGWIEPVAEHLLKRTWSEPRWDARRGSVVATERATLYGLPVVAGRTVDYGRIDPELSHEVFVRKALVERDWTTRHAFFAANGRALEDVAALEERTRRRDLLVDDETLMAWFLEQVPADVVSAQTFDRWFKKASRRSPGLLEVPREVLIRPQAADALDPAQRPDHWRQGELLLPLTYAFDPSSSQDGVTVHVPLKTLPGLRADGFEWLVPAFRAELVETLLRALPKEQRRVLQPIAEVAGLVLERVQPRREPLVGAVARELRDLRQVRVPAGALSLERLPAHLRMTFSVEEEDGTVVATGTDLAALKASVRPRLRAELAKATQPLVRHGLRDWPADLPRIPKAVALPGTNEAVKAWPTLVDEGEAGVGVAVLESRAARDAAMREGTRRLLLLNAPNPGRRVRDRLGMPQQLALATAPHGSLQAVLADATAAAVDWLVERHGGPAWDAEGFAALRASVVGDLEDVCAQVVELCTRILGVARDLDRRIEELRGPAVQDVRLDVEGQLRSLVHAGFLADVGVDHLADVLRYLRGAIRRLERLSENPAVDRDRMRGVQELEDRWRARGERPPEVRWMLQELRLSHFAQGLAAQGAPSAKRIRTLLEG